MAKGTRDKLKRTMDSVDNHLINVKAQLGGIIYIFQQAEENYQTVYAEQIVFAHSLMEAAEALRLACEQYNREYL
jgi:hypothetical protein